MRLQAVLMASALVAIHAQAAVETQVFLGFEACGETTENLVRWNRSGNAVTCTDHPRTRVGLDACKCGTHVLHARLDESMDNKTRSEIASMNDGGLEYGAEYWLQFDINVVEWVTDPRWSTVFQLHGTPNERQWGTCGGGRNPFTLTVTPDRQFAIAAINESFDGSQAEPTGALADVVWSEPLKLGQWKRVDVQIVPSTEAGLLKVWVDGSLAYDSGVKPIADKLGSRCLLPPDPLLYTKIGVYAKSTPGAKRSVLYDNYSIQRVVSDD